MARSRLTSEMPMAVGADDETEAIAIDVGDGKLECKGTLTGKPPCIPVEGETADRRLKQPLKFRKLAGLPRQEQQWQNRPDNGCRF